MPLALLTRDTRCLYTNSVSNELSVSELAAAVAPILSFPDPPSEADVEVVLRRLRNWTVAGAIHPIGQAHTGSGKHRRYDVQSAYIAAALNVLAENDQGIGVLVTAGRLLRSFSGPEPLIAGEVFERWKLAIKGTKEVFLIIGAGARGNESSSRFSVPALVMRDELSKEIRAWPGGVFVNLSAAFALIKV
jgi:hypothetical protein